MTSHPSLTITDLLIRACPGGKDANSLISLDEVFSTPTATGLPSTPTDEVYIDLAVLSLPTPTNSSYRAPQTSRRTVLNVLTVSQKAQISVWEITEVVELYGIRHISSRIVRAFSNYFGGFCVHPKRRDGNVVLKVSR